MLRWGEEEKKGKEGGKEEWEWKLMLDALVVLRLRRVAFRSCGDEANQAR